MGEAMTDHERDRLRKLAESLKSADPTGGNLEGVMAVAVLDCLGDVSQLHNAIDRACRIIESADARNLATDGPAGGRPPQMTLAEWKELYTVLDKARRGVPRPAKA